MDVDCFSGENLDERLFCFVDGCFTTSARNKNLGFHQFPGNDQKRVLKIYKNGVEKFVNRRQLWIEALNIDKEATTVIGKMRVCSLHFSYNDFIIADRKRPFSILKNTAIPRRNLPLRRSSKLTTRLQVRNFNRIKWRGRLAFQDPDGRVPMSRKSSGADREGRRDSTNQIDAKDMNNEGATNTGHRVKQLNGFSLVGFEAETMFDDKDDDDDDEDIEDDEVQCTSENQIASESTAENQITSELIIKEEPLSEPEQDLEDWAEDDDIIFDEAETLKEVETATDREQTKIDKITTKNVLEDLESTAGEEEDELGDDEDSQKVKEAVWRDRPCKVCGKKDCDGHPTSRPSENMFVCVVCSKVFPTPTQLDAHSIRHDDEMNASDYGQEDLYRNQYKDLTCHVCGKVLATKMTLKEHMLIHTGEKPHVCLLCGRAFRHKANLVVRINAHTIVREFECPMCPRMFSMRADLEDHKRTHTDQEYVCNFCRDAFHSKRALWTHQKVHRRSQRRNRKGAKKSGLPCKLCSKVLSTKNTLKEHMMIHSGEKPHECLLCGKMIRHKANFIIHVQSHGSSETYPCDLCDYSFPRRTDLRHHKQEAHGNKPFKCILCGIAFRKEKGLMEHVEEVHGDTSGKKDQLDGYDGFFQPHLLAGFGSADR